MSAEAKNSATGVWASVEGHVVDGVFTLGSFLGSSGQGAVFRTIPSKRAPSELAIKLVPVIATPTAELLSRWLAAGTLEHPHLLRVLEAGKCEIHGLHYLYAVMEYADQTLAQLLESRALTEAEVREMLVPTLSALAFLHSKNFVHGHLKPSNLLVVGDQIRLSGDTNRIVDEMGERVGTLSVHHPPEARDGRCSMEGDVWALGVMLCEALTRRQPSGLRGRDEDVVLPPDLPPSFHELVARCLSRSALDRPKVTDIEAWLQGKPLPPPAPPPIPEAEAMKVLESASPPAVAPAPPAPQVSVPSVSPPSAGATPSPKSESAPATVASAPATKPSVSAAPRATPAAKSRESTPPPLAPAAKAASVPKATPAPKAAAPESSSASEPAPRAPSRASDIENPKLRIFPLMLITFGVFVIAWAGLRGLQSDNPPPVAATAPSANTTRAIRTQPAAILPDAPADSTEYVEESAPELAAPPAEVEEDSAASDPTLAGVREVIPQVPRRASQTISGTVRVSVRVIVDPDGTVFAALAENPGPSRYFERLAIDAAKQWTFPPAENDAQRFMLVRFAFSRNGTTARATPAL